jgi:hypothetical protein
VTRFIDFVVRQIQSGRFTAWCAALLCCGCHSYRSAEPMALAIVEDAEWVTPFTLPHGEVVNGVFATLQISQTTYAEGEAPLLRLSVTSCDMDRSLWVPGTMLCYLYADYRLVDSNGQIVPRRTDVPQVQLTNKTGLVPLGSGEFFGFDQPLCCMYDAGPGRYELTVRLCWPAIDRSLVYPEALRGLLDDPGVHLWTGEMTSNTVAFEIAAAEAGKGDQRPVE